MAGASRPPAIRIDALDLGLESLTAPRVKLAVEVLGQVLQGEELEVAAVSDGEGVLVLNQRFTLELEDGSPLRSDLASALRSDDAEASDVHMVVHACAGGVSAGASTELASGFLNLQSLLGSEASESDHTIELIDERGAVAGALSIAVDALAALHQVLAGSHGPLAPAPRLARLDDDDDELLLRLGCGTLQAWPEASRNAARLRKETLFLCLELAVAPDEGGEAEADVDPLHESRSVRLRRLSARFDSVLSLRSPADAEARQLLRAALAPDGVEQDSDLFVLLLAETPKGARELGSAYINLRELLRAGADWEEKQLRLVAPDGGLLGVVSASISAYDGLRALLDGSSAAATAAAEAADAPPHAAVAAAPHALGGDGGVAVCSGGGGDGSGSGGEDDDGTTLMSAGHKPARPSAACSTRVHPMGQDGGPCDACDGTATEAAVAAAASTTATRTTDATDGGSAGVLPSSCPTKPSSSLFPSALLGGSSSGGGSRRGVLPPVRAPHRAAPMLSPAASAAGGGGSDGGVQLVGSGGASAGQMVPSGQAAAPEAVEQRRAYFRSRRDVLRAQVVPRSGRVAPVMEADPVSPRAKTSTRAERGSPAASSRSAVHRKLAADLVVSCDWQRPAHVGTDNNV